MVEAGRGLAGGYLGWWWWTGRKGKYLWLLVAERCRGRSLTVYHWYHRYHRYRRSHKHRRYHRHHPARIITPATTIATINTTTITAEQENRRATNTRPDPQPSKRGRIYSNTHHDTAHRTTTSMRGHTATASSRLPLLHRLSSVQSSARPTTDRARSALKPPALGPGSGRNTLYLIQYQDRTLCTRRAGVRYGRGVCWPAVRYGASRTAAVPRTPPARGRPLVGKGKQK